MTGLGNNERKIFLGIAQGKITYRAGRDAEKQEFDFVEGRIKGITRRDAHINDKDIKFYEIAIENGNNKFILSVPMDGSVARGIILSLAGIQNFSETTVKISPWLKDTYTNVSVYANGEKAGWVIDPKELPPVKEIKAGTKTFYDDSERVDLVEKMVDSINERIATEPASSNAPMVDYDQYPGQGGVVNDGLDNGSGGGFPG